MRYQFLVDTYATERLKVISVWSMFRDEDLSTRPLTGDARGRSVHEQMVHQCLSEDIWFVNLGVDVGAAPLPGQETRLEFIRQYAADSSARLNRLQDAPEEWWEEEVPFFDTVRTRCWVMVRRIAHTAHHRGQQTAMLRQLGRELHSTYGPTADTGGLMVDKAPTIYPYRDEEQLLQAESAGGGKRPLPVPPERPLTERPQATN